jgi:uncharacterized protein
MSRIAVVGGGISGMAAAYFLRARHEVWLFEQERRLGGHTNTVTVETPNGPLGIDTGFIVFNEQNYPRLLALFAELGVASMPSDMSFSVSDRRTGFEYSSRGPNGFFADRRNLFRPSHFGLLVEIRRFHRRARGLLGVDGVVAAGDDLGLQDWLDREGFSTGFASHFLYPMASSIWSASQSEVRRFPARIMARFFHNHGLLQMVDNPRWRVVRGGSSKYIVPLTSHLADRAVTGARIAAIDRHAEEVVIRFADGGAMTFDHVVIACHGDEVLPLLSAPTAVEREVFSAFETSRNETWLHTDASVLPRRHAARASWNYHIAGDGRGVRLSYHMNRLQRLETAEDYCVTLDPEGLVDESTVILKMTYRHPLYTSDALRAQRRWAEVSGRSRTHYCGAYWFDGFHEDGVRSAQRVADAVDVGAASWSPVAASVPARDSVEVG